MIDFRRYLGSLDSAVNAAWGEPLRFIPWVVDAYGKGREDETRPMLDTLGQVSLSKGVVQPMGAGFVAKIEAADITVSIQASLVADAYLRKGDRVVMLRRGLVFSISEQPVSDTSSRMTIKLIRLTDDELTEDFVS